MHDISILDNKHHITSLIFGFLQSLIGVIYIPDGGIHPCVLGEDTLLMKVQIAELTEAFTTQLTFELGLASTTNLYSRSPGRRK